jgi:hypothetical protein
MSGFFSSNSCYWIFGFGFGKPTTTEKLHEAFSQFGEVVHARW